MRRSCIIAARAAARDEREPDASDVWRAYRHIHPRARGGSLVYYDSTHSYACYGCGAGVSWSPEWPRTARADSFRAEHTGTRCPGVRAAQRLARALRTRDERGLVALRVLAQAAQVDARREAGA